MKRIALALAISSVLCSGAMCQKLLTTIPIQGLPGFIGVNTTTNMVYVPNQTLNAVTVVDGSSEKVAMNIPVTATPYAAAVNSTTNMIYVTSPGPSPSVDIIDGSSGTVVASVPATVPGAIAVNPVTNLVYFQNGSGAAISVLDGSTNQITDTLATSTCCVIEGIVVNSDTNRIYVGEAGIQLSQRQIVVIDGETNRFSTVQLPGICNLGSMAVDSTLNRIYVVDDVCAALYVISGVTNKVVKTVLPGYFGPMALNAQNHQVADFAINLLSFINGSTLTIVGGNVMFPHNQGAMNMTSGPNNRYYVGFFKNDGIAVVAGP